MSPAKSLSDDVDDLVPLCFPFGIIVSDCFHSKAQLHCNTWIPDIPSVGVCGPIKVATIIQRMK